MSFATSVNSPARRISSVASGQVVATYQTYQQAQRAVDHLSDSGFPVEESAIIGRDLRLVEQVVGRLTKARATVMGGASGAWFGLFVGLLVTLFVTGPEWIPVTIAALLIGAVWGAVFGFVAQWATHGQRDFASASAIVAGQYDVTVTDAHSERAAQLLVSLG
jgi:ascorbate-specific PTS system EIIC-type component UlaA